MRKSKDEFVAITRKKYLHMLVNLEYFKKHLEKLISDNQKQADDLKARNRLAAAEYFLGKTAAYQYCNEFIAIILRNELPWEK